MFNYRFTGRMTALILRSIFSLLLLFGASVSYAQTVTDFSGIWTQDTLKSDDFYKAFDVRCTITQTAKLFTIKTAFYDKSGQEITSRDNAYTLDGKEVSIEEEGGINKNLATWSADKKILTTRSTRTAGTDVYGHTAIYSLSNDGLVLTVLSADINPAGLKVKQIFNKNK